MAGTRENSLQQNEINGLFNRIVMGDISAFENIYNYYHDRIYRLVFTYTKSRELAEDTVQQVFLSVWERRTELRSVINAEAWLFQAAKFQTWNLLEKEYNARDFRDRLITILDNQAQTPADALHKKERQQLLSQLISSLPDKQLQVYRMAREQGLTYAEIAQHLGIGRETVKEHMAKALKKLKLLFQQHKDRLISLVIAFFSIFY